MKTVPRISAPEKLASTSSPSIRVANFVNPTRQRPSSPSTGDIQRNLGPTDGFSSISVGATYTKDNMKITGGIRYAQLGDAVTTVAADFRDNYALGVGFKIGYSY